MDEIDPDNLRLTDFLDLTTLQEIQDSFAAVAGVKATITDAIGIELTRPTAAPSGGADAAVTWLVNEAAEPRREGQEFVAPIIVNQQRLGSIRMSAGDAVGAPAALDAARLEALAKKYALPADTIQALAADLPAARAGTDAQPAALQFLFLMANAIARLCFQEFQLRQRINELTAVYNVAMMLADARDLQSVLDRTVQVVCELMEAKASSLRLIDTEKDELVIKATFNLSPAYLNKGPLRMSRAEIDRVALSPEGFEYVRDMATDERVQYPQEARRENVHSMLSAGMRYKGKAIGVLRVYTATEQMFSPLKIDLLKAVAAQAAAAIENARLLHETFQAARMQKQLELASDVQHRMIPRKAPDVPGVDLASVYVPMFQLGGDLFDYITLPDDNIGLAIADVSGKGVPASLIMASVRAFLRAQVDYVYYLYEVIHRINLMLCRDTKVGEFVTLFYGVLDARSLRLTYCNAGHPPAMLLRDGQITELSSDNLVLGVDPDEPYRQNMCELRRNDILLLYTDGVTDGMNFQQQTFGRQRLMEALKKGGATAELVAQNILWELRKFAGMTRNNDDITMVVARIK